MPFPFRIPHNNQNPMIVHDPLFLHQIMNRMSLKASRTWLHATHSHYNVPSNWCLATIGAYETGSAWISKRVLNATATIADSVRCMRMCLSADKNRVDSKPFFALRRVQPPLVTNEYHMKILIVFDSDSKLFLCLQDYITEKKNMDSRP